MKFYKVMDVISLFECLSVFNFRFTVVLGNVFYPSVCGVRYALLTLTDRLDTLEQDTLEIINTILILHSNKTLTDDDYKYIFNELVETMQIDLFKQTIQQHSALFNQLIAIYGATLYNPFQKNFKQNQRFKAHSNSVQNASDATMLDPHKLLRYRCCIDLGYATNMLAIIENNKSSSDSTLSALHTANKIKQQDNIKRACLTLNIDYSLYQFEHISKMLPMDEVRLVQLTYHLLSTCELTRDEEKHSLITPDALEVMFKAIADVKKYPVLMSAFSGFYCEILFRFETLIVSGEVEFYSPEGFKLLKSVCDFAGISDDVIREY